MHEPRRGPQSQRGSRTTAAEPAPDLTGTSTQARRSPDTSPAGPTHKSGGPTHEPRTSPAALAHEHSWASTPDRRPHAPRRRAHTSVATSHTNRAGLTNELPRPTCKPGGPHTNEPGKAYTRSQRGPQTKPAGPTHTKLAGPHTSTNGPRRISGPPQNRRNPPDP